MVAVKAKYDSLSSTPWRLTRLLNFNSADRLAPCSSYHIDAFEMRSSMFLSEKPWSPKSTCLDCERRESVGTFGL